jgi:hypothetical protein
MNKYSVRTQARMKRVKQFCADRLAEAPNPAVTDGATALDTVITDLQAAGVRQIGGNGSTASAVHHRHGVVNDLRRLMASLAKAAKRLDPDTYPDVAGIMRMRGAYDSFPKLLTRALLFQETLTPIKAAFVALGAPADVDVELGDLITALQGEGTRKITGVDTQVNGTFSIKAKVREGVRCMQQLDAIFTQLYRKDPVLLAEWKVTNRATPYARAATAAPAPDPGSGDSSGGTPVVTS